MANLKQEIGLLFETSWEVCNKIGGIYAVLSTKARALHEQFGDRLVFIGPDVWSAENPSPYFQERKTLLKGAAQRMELPFGISIRVGRWKCPGSPLVVLVKFAGVEKQLPDIYARMWQLYGVDSLHAYGDYGEGCAYSVATAIVIKSLAAYLGVEERKTVAHFNEWTTGMGLLYLKDTSPEIATLFTTHATSIGRSICGNGKPLYDYFGGYNGDQMARELNMQSKHSLEKAAAHQADCFTAVSEVTARECGQLLEIRPQVVTPNGFEPDFVPEGSRYSRRVNAGRERLLAIARAMTGRDYRNDTFLIATSGRNEYRNKGLDVFLDSAALISSALHEQDRDVLAFVLVPAWVREPSPELVLDLESEGHVPVNPSWLTHRLNNEDSDLINCRIAQLESDGAIGGDRKLKVIYVPVYLDGGDGIVGISYYDLLPAIDLTIFPSYYEPWGYTPLESVAFSVPTITTDKSGFGQWVLSSMPNSIPDSGVKVVPRNDSDYHQTVHSIAGAAISYLRADAPDIARGRMAAAQTAAKADWKYFIKHYDEAFLVALSRRDERTGDCISQS